MGKIRAKGMDLLGVKGLLGFHKEREVTDRPQPSKLRRKLWSGWRQQEKDFSRLKELASSAERLQELRDHPGWVQDIEDAKLYYLSQYDAITKNPNNTDRQLQDAAVAYQTIQGFFKEVNFRIQGVMFW